MALWCLLRLALGRRLPVASGELRVRGSGAAVTIRRDHNGVPHIDAQSEHDAFFALGFCQGQDRAAQLEVLWRVGRGRLAEWVGERGHGADRMSRRVGFRRAAEKQLAVIPDGPLAQITAFAAGVCAGHTAATYEQLSAAFAAGVRGVTHLFNAMTPLQSRDPGAVGAALDDPDSWCGLIVDGYHVHDAALRVAIAAKPAGKK